MAKLTKGCQKVLEVLKEQQQLASAQDIFGQMRGDDASAPGLTTVYRSLESLVSMGLVQAVDLGDGERRYEMVKPGEHHHHLVCDSCRESVHLERCLVDELVDSIRTKYGFHVKGHILEIFGMCRTCQQKA